MVLQNEPHFDLFTDKAQNIPISDPRLHQSGSDPTLSDSRVDMDKRPAADQVQTLHLAGSVVLFQIGGNSNTKEIPEMNVLRSPICVGRAAFVSVSLFLGLVLLFL